MASRSGACMLWLRSGRPGERQPAHAQHRLGPALGASETVAGRVTNSRAEQQAECIWAGLSGRRDGGRGGREMVRPPHLACRAATAGSTITHMNQSLGCCAASVSTLRPCLSACMPLDVFKWSDKVAVALELYVRSTSVYTGGGHTCFRDHVQYICSNTNAPMMVSMRHHTHQRNQP